MNPSIRRFTLDTNATRSQISIPVTLNDTGRIWHITLTEGGICYRIEDGCLAVLSVKRPNGSHYEEVCPVMNNVQVVYDFSQNEKTAAVEGIHECEVTVYGRNRSILTSATFTMVVGTRAVSSDDITITDDDRTLIDYCALKEVERQSAEAERQLNEVARIETHGKLEATLDLVEDHNKNYLELSNKVDNIYNDISEQLTEAFTELHDYTESLVYGGDSDA